MSLSDASIRIARVQLSDHLWFHPGTEIPSEICDDGGEAYTESARVPVVERRRLTPEELQAISSEWHWPASNCIASFPIDRSFLSLLDHREVLDARDPGSERFSGVGECLWASLCGAGPVFSLGRAQWLGISSRPSGLRTSTFDSSIGRRIGIHLDSWDRTPLTGRHGSRTRLCINLGLRTRSLLFVPYEIRAVASALADDPLAHNANIGERFCARFRDTPVLRLDVPPGWAYLAPTDNILHDGSSEPSSAPDVTAAWLGRIGYRASLV